MKKYRILRKSDYIKTGDEYKGKLKSHSPSKWIPCGIINRISKARDFYTLMFRRPIGGAK